MANDIENILNFVLKKTEELSQIIFVTWPNSLWHIDGHHSLIRWQFVIHGCCDPNLEKSCF